VKKSALVATALLVAVTTACSFQNSYEKKAQKVTEALIANDMTPVKDEIPPGALTRVQVAEYSTELSGYGKLKSVKEDPAGCPASMHCFDVQFENRLVREQMLVDDKGKIARFNFHAVDPGQATATPS
jgi:hypothetical protein